MLNVLVATKDDREPGGLEHIGDTFVLHTSTLSGWSNAANALLDDAVQLGSDALFLDDDVTLTEGCLDAVQAYYDQADLFGLDLHTMSGERQQGARHILDADGVPHDWVHPGPAYVAHVSTSAIYIKHAAVAALRFPVWPGVHWEDVAFCLDAWLKGLRIMAVPGRVDHAIEGGVGTTKRHTPEFWVKWSTNMQHMTAWMSERGVPAALADGRVPVGVREI